MQNSFRFTLHFKADATSEQKVNKAALMQHQQQQLASVKSTHVLKYAYLQTKTAFFNNS
jgi:hypothetical protein